MTKLNSYFSAIILGLLAMALAGCGMFSGGTAPTNVAVASAVPAAAVTQRGQVDAPTPANNIAGATATLVVGNNTVTGTEAGERFGLLGDVTPKVFVQLDAETEPHEGVFGETLAIGTILNTDATGRARLLLENGTTVRLAPNTQLVLEDRQKPVNSDILTQVNLLIGKVWVILGRGEDETLTVETPIGVGAVRGSFMSVEYIPGDPDNPNDDILIITCLEGDCSLTTDRGTLPFTTGQKVIVIGRGNAPSGIIPMTQEDIQDWLDNNVEILIFFGVIPQTGQPTDSLGPIQIPIQIPGIGGVIIVLPPTATPTETPTPTPTPTNTPGGGGGSTLPTAAPAAGAPWPNTLSARPDGVMLIFAGLVVGVVGVGRFRRRK